MVKGSSKPAFHAASLSISAVSMGIVLRLKCTVLECPESNCVRLCCN